MIKFDIHLEAKTQPDLIKLLQQAIDRIKSGGAYLDTTSSIGLINMRPTVDRLNLVYTL